MVKMESKMNEKYKDNLNVQKNNNNKTNITKSDHACCADFNCGENVTHNQNYLKKIGVLNPHPWSLIGLR